MWWWCFIGVLWWCTGAAAAEGTCYPPGGVAGIVVATVIVTLVVGGLGAALAWRYWWTPRQKHRGLKRPDQQSSDQQKSTSDFAFDNPYFRNNQEPDEQDGTTGRNRSCMNNKSSLRSSKLSEASAKAKKARGGKNHFGFGGGKKKALDDSCIASVEPERTFVSLRGHDFTGLGFNICGNMRDGILVKDVLHRGPASESGLIKAGDKIVNVTVSFTNIVYEDALTILSYASPYDVQLEIERIPSSSSDKLASTSGGGSKRLGSCSFNNSGQKLFHPLYRSQSIDDLTQIDGGGGGTFPSHGGGPRRSQSVGVAAHKLAAHFKDSKDTPEDSKGAQVSLILSTTGSLNEKMLANVMTDGGGRGLQWEKRFEDTLQDNDQDMSSSPFKEQKSETPDVRGKKDSKAYLDYPHNKLKLETRRGESSDGVSSGCRKNDLDESGRRGKTVVEVSSWQKDQDTARESSRREDTSKEMSSRGRACRRGDEENDSDVSRDSLEVSHRGYQKRNMKTTSSSTTFDGSILNSIDTTVSESPLTDPRQFYPQKKENAPLVKSTGQFTEKGDNLLSKGRTDRMYANDRSKQSTRVHSNSLSSNEDHSPPVEKDITVTCYSRTRRDDSEGGKDAVDHRSSGARDTQVKSSPAHHHRNVCTSPYGERQKLSSSEAFTQGYGCNNRIVVNGGTDDYQGGKLKPSSNCDLQSSSQTDSRKSEDRSLQQQKFAKKTSPAGGMFTQINPFQMPSKQQRNFRPWVGREDLSKHHPPQVNGSGEQFEFQGSPRSSGYSETTGPKLSLKDSSIKHRQF